MGRRCQRAGGGGTCPVALLQVTLLAWRLGPEGGAVAVSAGCEWCLDTAEGSGHGGAGLRGQTCLAAVSSWFGAPGRELRVEAPGGWPGQGKVRGAALRCLPCPVVPVPGCPAALPEPFPVDPSGLLLWRPGSLESSPLSLCVCAVPPLPSLSFSGPIAGAACAPLGSSLPGPIDSVLRQPGRLSGKRQKERERPLGVGEAADGR